jgi:hypothetical protein
MGWIKEIPVGSECRRCHRREINCKSQEAFIGSVNIGVDNIGSNCGDDSEKEDERRVRQQDISTTARKRGAHLVLPRCTSTVPGLVPKESFRARMSKGSRPSIRTPENEESEESARNERKKDESSTLLQSLDDEILFIGR